MHIMYQVHYKNLQNIIYWKNKTFGVEVEVVLTNVVGRVTGASVVVLVFELELEFWDKNIGDPGLARMLGPEEVLVFLDTLSSSSESLRFSGFIRAGDLASTACKPRLGKLGVATKFAA